MKNKNIGGCVMSTQPDQQRRPQCKNAQKCKNYQTLKTFFLARFAHSSFYKIHISGAANRHAQFNMQNMFCFVFFCFFFFFSFSKQSS